MKDISPMKMLDPFLGFIASVAGLFLLMEALDTTDMWGGDGGICDSLLRASVPIWAYRMFYMYTELGKEYNLLEINNNYLVELNKGLIDENKSLKAGTVTESLMLSGDQKLDDPNSAAPSPALAQKQTP